MPWYQLSHAFEVVGATGECHEGMAYGPSHAQTQNDPTPWRAESALRFGDWSSGTTKGTASMVGSATKKGKDEDSLMMTMGRSGYVNKWLRLDCWKKTLKFTIPTPKFEGCSSSLYFNSRSYFKTIQSYRSPGHICISALIRCTLYPKMANKNKRISSGFTFQLLDVSNTQNRMPRWIRCREISS